MKDNRTEQEIIAETRKALISLEQRALTARQVESVVWTLWGFVRENQNSLDSERCCRKILDIINGATMAVASRVETLAGELDQSQDELRASIKETKRLSKELAKTCGALLKLETALDTAGERISEIEAELVEAKKPPV